MKELNIVHANGQLNYKEVCGRIKKALQPFGKHVSHKTSINQLRNTIYVDVICGQAYERIRISTHEPRADAHFEGLSIVINAAKAGIVQPIRKHVNFMVSNRKIDHKTNMVVKSMYKGQTLEYLTDKQLNNLLNAIVEVLEKRPKVPCESCRVDITPIEPTLINKEEGKHGA